MLSLIPCINHFNIITFFPRFQNGVIIMFYYYLLSITLIENYYIKNYTSKFLILTIFFNIGYHLDPNVSL